jgi:type I site-specific restriction-modification system R (restriction) subunit
VTTVREHQSLVTNRFGEWRKIAVVTDEVRHSQYDFIDDVARHIRDALSHVSSVGFTGTPIEKTGAKMRAVFGD